MTAYRIRSGGRFRLADGTLKTVGDVIELDDDVAQMHVDKLEPAAEELVQAPALADPVSGEA
jgi:hypothetical protein